jgi:hypothetical protein
MKKKFCVLIEDDWELMGNGSGNVASHQYLPSLFLMNLARKLNLKLTFMVEVAQQLAFIRFQDADPRIRLQRQLWDATVRLMKESGFDVQLHLHPQWCEATLKEGRLKVGLNWNLASYDSLFQEKLLKDSVEYLQDLLQDLDPAFKIHAFKAGTWALQPFEVLQGHLTRFNIQIILGVRKGLVIPNAQIDYTTLEEDTLPYHPDQRDVTRVSRARNSLVIIPLAYYSPDPWTLSRLAANAVKAKLGQSQSGRDQYDCSETEAREGPSPLEGKVRLHLSSRPYMTHLKIGGQPFCYLKSSFDAVIQRLRKHPAERIPIIIESHTKLYAKSYLDVERFIRYLMDKYAEEIEFTDLTSFWQEVTENPQYVRYGDVA